MHQAYIPSKFWNYSFAIAVYLINRMPTITLQKCSPFEKLYNKVPSLDHIRVFGCACFPLVTPYNTHKLQYKTYQCVFPGFALGYKGYICYHVPSKRMIISRHVIFDESRYPFSIEKSSSHHNVISSSSTLSDHILVHNMHHISSHSSTQIMSIPHMDTTSAFSPMQNLPTSSPLVPDSLDSPCSSSDHSSSHDGSITGTASPTQANVDSIPTDDNNISISPLPNGRVSVVLDNQSSPIDPI